MSASPSKGRHRKRPDNGTIDADGFRRVHPLTPLLRFWGFIAAIVTIFILNFNLEMVTETVDYLRGGHIGEAIKGIGIAAAAFVVICLLIWWISRIWWRQLGFKLTDEEISIRRGVISTSFRSARYDRTQAVDVVETFMARFFGLAVVRVETAGGQGSALEVGFLKKKDAEALRLEVLRHVRGAIHDPAAQGFVEPGDVRNVDDAGVHAPDSHEAGTEIIAPIPTWRSLAASATRLGTVITGVFIAALFILPVPTRISIPFLVGVVPSIWNLLDTSWRFTARLARDEKSGARVLNVNYGLTDLRRQSIRLSRIHAVKVSQPLLWRPFGWYEVQVSVAGYGAKGGGKQSGSTRILPVGSREQAMELFALVSDLSRDELETYARPEGPTQPTFTSPKRAWLASPLDLHKQAVTFMPDVVITHAGLITRRVAAIHTSHIQELTYKAGPIAQALNVATVRFELVAGPVAMAAEDLDPADVAAVLERLRSRELPELNQPV